MPGAFSPIFPPPQSIDSLDSWGSLDGLPFSLDSSVWTKAGLYGLTVSDAEPVRQQVSDQRTRTSAIAGMAVSGDSADGQAVLELMGTGEATTGESVIGGVTVAIGVDPSRASSGQTLVMLRIRPGLMDDTALSNEGLDLYRVRTHVPESLIVSGGDADVSRIILLYGGGDVISADDVLPEYKGWGWRHDAQTDQGCWSPIFESGQHWHKLPGGKKDWRGIVEWQ